jgi:hypothetical protein
LKRLYSIRGKSSSDINLISGAIQCNDSDMLAILFKHGAVIDGNMNDTYVKEIVEKNLDSKMLDILLKHGLRLDKLKLLKKINSRMLDLILKRHRVLDTFGLEKRVRSSSIPDELYMNRLNLINLIVNYPETK